MAIAIGPSMSAQSLDFGRLTEEYSKLTVREVISSTSGVALAQLVATRAAIQLLTLVDARRFCRVELVPPGEQNESFFCPDGVRLTTFRK